MAFALVSASHCGNGFGHHLCHVRLHIFDRLLHSIAHVPYNLLLVKPSWVCFEAKPSSALSTAHSTISLKPSADRDIIDISSLRRFFGLLGLENIEGVALVVRNLSSSCP